MRIAALPVLCTLIASAPALADGMVGDWFTSSSRDNFDDTSKLVAMSTSNAGDFVIGVRCFNHNLSILIMPKDEENSPFRENSLYSVKFRGGSGPIINDAGMGIQRHGLAMVDSQKIMQAIVSSEKFAFRIDGEGMALSQDIVFQPHRSRDALAEVVKECPPKSD